MIHPKAKKQFGQHFLTNPTIAQRMAASLKGIGGGYKDVIEVGPGKGIFTQALLDLPEIRLWPVEVDPDMSNYLSHHFPTLKPALVQKDFLNLDFRSVVGENPFAVVGNFPYNISSQILFKVLDHVPHVPEVLGMFQKEVAERIVANPGTKAYGILSVLVGTYYSTELVFKLKPGSFDPPPKVQSAVIQLVRHTSQLEGIDEGLYFKVVKKAFNQRRKMLRNGLSEYLEGVQDVSEDLLARRPEELKPLDFQALTKSIAKARFIS